MFILMSDLVNNVQKFTLAKKYTQCHILRTVLAQQAEYSIIVCLTLTKASLPIGKLNIN